MACVLPAHCSHKGVKAAMSFLFAASQMALATPAAEAAQVALSAKLVEKGQKRAETEEEGKTIVVLLVLLFMLLMMLMMMTTKAMSNVAAFAAVKCVIMHVCVYVCVYECVNISVCDRLLSVCECMCVNLYAYV